MHVYTHTHTHTHTHKVQYSRSVETQTFVRTFPVTQSCMRTHVYIMHMHAWTHAHTHTHIVQCNRVHTNICDCSGVEKPVLSARTTCGHPTATFLCCTSPHHLGCAGTLLFAFPFFISYRLCVRMEREGESTCVVGVHSIQECVCTNICAPACM